jgi:fucose permease
MSSLATPPNRDKQKISQTIGYYLAFIALGLVAATLGPTLRGLAENTGSMLHQISYLFLARSLGYLLGSLFGGRLYDRMPGHPLMAITLLAMAITMFLTPLIPVLWVLMLVLLVMGMGEGGVDVGGNTMLVWVHRDKVEPYMNGLHFFFGLGAFVAPIIIVQAGAFSGELRWAFWILALLILPISLWVLRQPSPTPQTVSKEKVAGEANGLLVFLIAVFFFLNVGAEAAYAGWVSTYSVTANLATGAMAGYLTSAFWGMLTFGRLIGIPISTRARPRYILLADLLGCIISVGIILLWPNSITAVWLGTLGLGLSMASVFPTTLNLAERRMIITGKVTGWFFVGASSGGMFLPWFIGQFIEATGPKVVMTAILFDLLLALGLFFILIFYSARASGAREV